jgi:hypothetical protein
MTTRAVAGGRGPARVRGRSPAEVRALVSRFDKTIRAAVEQVSASHVYAQDLLWTFPGLLAEIAVTSDGARRDGAMALVKAGAPLASIARLLGVPFWMRKLPPEAFSAGVPRLPADAEFGLQIANHLPRQAGHAESWLKTVAAAYAAADATFAVWAAREHARLDAARGVHGIAAIGLYAWFSARPESVAGGLVARPFQADFSAEQARDHARAWFEELQMQLYAPARAARFAHVNRATNVDGIAFERLATPDALRAEGQRMNHCVGRYGNELACGNSLLYALSEGSERVATLEVRLQPTGRPVLWCLSGPGNAEVPHRVWSAVTMWLARWSQREGLQVEAGSFPPSSLKFWIALWKPYWLAKGRQEYLPFAPWEDALDHQHRSLEYCLR